MIHATGILVLAASALVRPDGATVEESSPAPLSAAEFEAIRERLDLRKQPWARIPWKATVTEARRLAAREKKPIFLVVNTGNCLGFV